MFLVRINVAALATGIDFVCDANHGIASEIIVGDVVDGVVLQDLQRLPDQPDVLRRGVDQEIDVFRGASAAVRDDRESANQEIPGAVRVQRPREPDEVFDLRFTCVRTIIRVIHASASSKLPKRNTPRGTSAPVPRSAASVR